MTTMVNNFTIQEPLCSLHTEPCSYISLENCRMRLLCHRCVSFHNRNSPSSGSILSLSEFYTFVQECVAGQEQKLREQSYLQIDRMIAEKKKQIQHRLYNIFQSSIRKLNQDKQKIFNQLDNIGRIYSAQQQKFHHNIQQRAQIINYLNQFCADQSLFRLKIIASSDYGLGGWIAQLRGLQILGDQFGGRDVNNIVGAIRSQMQLREDCSLISKFQAVMKQYREQNIVTAMMTPMKMVIPRQQHYYYNNQVTQRRNQSQQNIQIRTPKTFRQQSFAQLPKLVLS